MRQYLRLHRNVFPFAVFIFALMFQSCADDPAASIYDPNKPVGATPTITAISVEGGGGLISGVSIVVIDGTNFTADSSKILVFFDAVKVTVLSATPTKIRVKAPTMVKDSVNVRISIQGSENFNVAKYIDVKFSAMLFGNFTATEEAYGIACDKTGQCLCGDALKWSRNRHQKIYPLRRY